MGRKHAIANEQLSRLIGANPIIFKPITYREPLSNSPIKVPWDNSVLKNGDIITLKWCFKITQNKGIPYLRKMFDEIVIIYQCDKSPEREYHRNSEENPAAETTSMENTVVDSVTKSVFVMPNFDAEDDKDDEK